KFKQARNYGGRNQKTRSPAHVSKSQPKVVLQVPRRPLGEFKENRDSRAGTWSQEPKAHRDGPPMPWISGPEPPEVGERYCPRLALPARYTQCVHPPRPHVSVRALD